MLKTIFVIVCGVIAAANVIPNADVRIIRGKNAQPGQIPFQVLLALTNGKGFCGGVLISDTWVLTVAHCVTDFSNPNSIEVHLGATILSNRDEPGRVIQKAQKIIIHEKYDLKKYISPNDIALIKLSNPIEFTSTISAISLPKSNIGDFAGEMVIVSGFGYKSMENPTMAKVLQYAPLKVISNAACIRSGYEKWLILPTIVCAVGRSTENICRGDSGGPIYHNGTKPILIGLAAFGEYNCETGSPGGYTRVSKYLDWISKHTGISV